METYYIKKFIDIIDKYFKDVINIYQNKKIAVLISGGIDSSIIGYFTVKYFSSVIFFTLNSPTATDLKFSKIISQFLKQKLQIVNFNQKNINTVSQIVKKILIKNEVDVNPTYLSLATGFFLLLKEIKNQQIDTVFTGQGPDVLLAGYKKYHQLPSTFLNQKIKDDLYLIEIDKKRDQAVADYFNIKLENPYLTNKFINFCLSVPPELKINQLNNIFYEKYLSRKVGQFLNLPKEVIFRHKKAFQYSTKIRNYFKGVI